MPMTRRMHGCPILLNIKTQWGSRGKTPSWGAVLKGAPLVRRGCAMPPEAACVYEAGWAPVLNFI